MQFSYRGKNKQPRDTRPSFGERLRSFGLLLLSGIGVLWRGACKAAVYLWNWICHFCHLVTEMRPTKGVFVAALVLIALCFAGVSAPSAFALAQKKQVSVLLNDEAITVTTNAQTVAELIANMGVTLGEGDVIAPILSHPLEQEDYVHIRSALNVLVTADGQTRQVDLVSGTVADALYMAGVTLGEFDEVTPSLTQQVTRDMNINVSRVNIHFEVEEKSIPYQEITQIDVNKYEGTTELTREGEEGVRELQIRVVERDGVETERTVYNEVILQPAISRIITKGTKVKATPTPKPSATKTKTPTKTPAPTIKQGSSANYSDSQIEMVAILCYTEARGNGLEGLQAVANVLLNRCNSSKFGGSIEEEIFRSGQFSPASDRERFMSYTPDSQSRKAARQVFNEGLRLLPSNVLYFRAARLGESWGKRTFYATYGDNNFFK